MSPVPRLGVPINAAGLDELPCEVNVSWVAPLPGASSSLKGNERLLPAVPLDWRADATSVILGLEVHVASNIGQKMPSPNKHLPCTAGH